MADDVFDLTIIRELLDNQAAELARKLTPEGRAELLKAADIASRWMAYLHLHRAKAEARLGKETVVEAETYLSRMLGAIERVLTVKITDQTKPIEEYDGQHEIN